MRIPILLFALTVLGFPTLLGWSSTANHTQTVFESPDGSFEVQEVTPQDDNADQKIFIVSKTNPREKQLLWTEASLWGNTWYSSPDSNWLVAEIREVHEVGSMQLFRRIDGLKFEKVRDFSARAWASLSAKRRITKGEEGIIDFVSWSPDNARLLIQLRGPVHGDANDRPWFTKWSVYFNAQTQKFEYTPYLDRWNPGVFVSPSADDYDDRMALAPASAEPLVDTLSEEEWKKRQTESDQVLNHVYHQVLAKSDSQSTVQLRRTEIDWIKQRDKVTDDYAKHGTPPNPTLRRLQSIVDITNERIDALKRDYLQPAN